MCKRCNEIEIEMQAADEYGFALTLAEYEAELEALQNRHAVEQKRAADSAYCTCQLFFDDGRNDPPVCEFCGKPQSH